MGIRLELINYTRRFGQLRRPPSIINDLSAATKEDKENLNKLIYTKHGSDLLSNLPSCDCGELDREDLIGVFCEECQSVCKPAMEQTLEPILWFRAPKGVQALINPTIWWMLCSRFARNRFNVIMWLCDTSYTPKVRTPDVVDQLIAAGVDRGYNNFVNNFDKIMNILFELKAYRSKSKSMDDLRTVLMQYRDCIFSQYLPIPNRALLVIEDSTMGMYIDPIIVGAVDAIRTMVSIDDPNSGHSVRRKENRVAKTLDQISIFYNGVYTTTFAGKPGVFRKHIYGTRCDFSFRAVISSLTCRHDYRELFIPWGIGVSLFRYHLVNKLYKVGMSATQSIEFLQSHAQKYHEQLDKLFQELIDESPYLGVPCVFQRNPSLGRASAQALFITKVKTDVHDPTVSFSILDVVGPNADYDGDQMNGTLALDHYISEAIQNLAPHKSVLDMSEPRKISKNLSIPKPVLSTIANWLDKKEAIDPVKMQRMEQLPALA